MRVTMLGCGSSAGVPFIGCHCPVCTSTDPKNNRTRVSLLLVWADKHVLIDTSPDLRQQALREKITKVDAVMYTHDHADHVHGIDELRSFNFLSGEAIAVWGDFRTIELLKNRFAYAFLPKPDNLWYRPCLEANVLVDKAVGEFELFGQKITYFEQGHGRTKSLGYRIGNFAYSTDTDYISDAGFEALKGVEVWIVDCLRPEPSYSHAHLEMTLGWIHRVKPKRAILTHMNHDFDYETLLKSLPQGVEPGYDGLQFKIEG